MSETVSIQIKPLNPQVAGIWENAWSDYPDTIKIPMEDGHVVTYRREIEQPHPQCIKAIDLIKVMKGHTYGGNGKHTKKSR